MKPYSTNKGINAPSKWQTAKKLIVKTCLVLATFGGLVGLANFCHDYIVSKTKPELSFVYFNETPQGPRIVEGNEILVQGKFEDFVNGSVPLPLNLAIRNIEAQTLEVAKIVVKLPHGVKVRSTVKPSVSRNPNELIYEQEFGFLAPLEAYTPLQRIDELEIPMRFTVVPIITLSSDNIPIVFIPILSDPSLGQFDQREIDVSIGIIFSTRKQVDRIFRILMQPSVSLLMDLPSSEESKKNEPHDFASDYLIAASITPSSWDSRWSGKSDDDKPQIEYIKYTNLDGTFQRISVNGRVRRVIIDKDKDGFVDLELLDTDDSIGFETVLRLVDRKPMIDWQLDWLVSPTHAPAMENN